MTVIRFQDDPIFAVIERHRRLSARYSDAVDSIDGMDDDDPRFEAADAITASSCQAMLDHAVVLVRSKPTTIAGVMALMRYAASLEEWQTPADGRDKWETSWPRAFLSTLADALAKIIAK